MWPQKNIKMFVDISCTDLFTQCNFPFMKVAAMLPSPCNNCFLTEIQPVIKLWKFWQLQTNRNFFWCSHFIIWWKSLGKWWKILCFINESQCIYFFSGCTKPLVELLLLKGSATDVLEGEHQCQTNIVPIGVSIAANVRMVTIFSQNSVQCLHEHSRLYWSLFQPLTLELQVISVVEAPSSHWPS